MRPPAPLGLRNSKGQERLSNLALLHIEREYVIKILKEDMEKMINTFGKGVEETNIFSSD